ncbi:LCP family protein [Microbacterium sp. YJN-G]|uniref:LCP family protein n=1 Tax=Microbacterium sp. YJN-G TaxID=2763257 RepID=UPI001877894A|nr:LCP family protein [Microbacterium sp. YJN-G]
MRDDRAVTASDPVLDAPRGARPRRQHRWVWVTALTIVGLLLGVAVAAFAYLATLASSYDQAETMPTNEVFPTTRPPATNPKAVNILLLGSDSRSGLGGSVSDIRGQRADTMLLVHIPADRSGVQIISFMRDNWVEIPGHGEAKLNAALAYGGTPLLVQTLESIVDVRIDHVAITDFEGFKGLSTALDGVTVNNEVAFSKGGHRYEQGPIELQGDAALGYVRERYSFPDGDYQRVRNQQAFIKGMLDKLVSRETLTDPARIAASVDALAPYLAVDEGLDAGTVAALGLSLRDVDKSEILFLTSPTHGTGTVGSQSIVRPDWDGLAALSQALKDDKVPEYAATHTGQ